MVCPACNCIGRCCRTKKCWQASKRVKWRTKRYSRMHRLKWVPSFSYRRNALNSYNLSMDAWLSMSVFTNASRGLIVKKFWRLPQCITPGLNPKVTNLKNSPNSNKGFLGRDGKWDCVGVPKPTHDLARVEKFFPCADYLEADLAFRSTKIFPLCLSPWSSMSSSQTAALSQRPCPKV